MKKTLTRLGCIFLSLCSLDCTVGYAENVTEGQENNLRVEEVIVAAHYFLASAIEDDNMWEEEMTVNDFRPLYDASGSIAAYYVTFKNGAYAVINNDINNPAALEYGIGGNEYIDDLILGEKNLEIVYLGPQDVHTMSEIGIINTASLKDNYPELLTADETLSSIVKKFASDTELVNEGTYAASVKKDDDYWFIPSDSMPSGKYKSYAIPCAGIKWAITSDYDSIAENHCGAVCITNLALYFAKKHSSLKVNGKVYDTFVKVYDIIGKGPKSNISKYAVNYFSTRGVSLKYSDAGTSSLVISALDKDRPVAILVARNAIEWHWILSVGYRKYESGKTYFRIVDGWNRNMMNYYLPGSGATWISGTQYWIE